MDRQASQGWRADPFGLHEWRYFSAGRPTRLVRDGSIETYDEPPAQHFAPADALAANAALAGGGADGAGLAAGATDDSATQAEGDTGMMDHGLRSIGLATRGSGVTPFRRRTGLVYASVATTAVVAVIAFVAIVGPTSRGSHSGSHQADLAAFVKASAESTLDQKTADVSLTATTEVNGSLVSLHGKGQLDFAANALAFNLSATYSGTALAESEIMIGRAVYIEVSANGQSLAQYLGGKHWLELPVAASVLQSAAPQDSPVWSLQLLERQGGKVVSIGSRSVGGLTCSGYAVTPSKQALLAAAQREWAQQDLSRSEQAAAREMLTDSTPPEISVWLDPTRQVVCELDVAMQMYVAPPLGSGRASSTGSLQMALTFTHYGGPVDITPPPAADTVSLQSGGTLSFRPSEGQS
jgi:hypothetical protein